MSTLAVVEEILRTARVPMTVREIVERAGVRLPSRSKTPDTVVARDLAMDIKRQGASSRFTRTAPGLYTVRNLAGLALVPLTDEAVAAPPTSIASAALKQERAPALAAKRSDSARDAGPASSSVR
jgi:HB1, ASXL, restriction endonuclease HTH domain